jgi:hypothetical protein
VRRDLTDAEIEDALWLESQHQHAEDLPRHVAPAPWAPEALLALGCGFGAALGFALGLVCAGWWPVPL